MSYFGENKFFSFRDGYCENLPNVTISSAEMVQFGRTISRFFKRFSVGGEESTNTHILYALCCGLSECGKDVYVCENTDLPSFKFGLPLLSTDCGIFISGNNCIKISFFNANGFTASPATITSIMNALPAPFSEKCGKITSSTSFRNIYINNLSDTLKNKNNLISAGISCGNRSVRLLWQKFFSGENDSLVFQVSDDGQRVNAYSSQVGFVSYEKLTLAYAMKLSSGGRTVYLPDNFNYAVDFAETGNSLNIKQFSSVGRIPQEALQQRFLYDPLYMCIHLAENKEEFIKIINSIPKLATAKREITVDNFENVPCDKIILESKGKIIISRNGRNRLSLTAQAFSSETASELCSLWSDKLRSIASDKNAL